MQIAGYLKTSLIEWPGKISSVIFTPGCNFACPFCHNRDLVDPERITKIPEINEQTIFDDLKERKKWIDAVIVTGGEPTIRPDLDKFLEKIKEMGFLTMLETNGSKPETIVKLLNDKIVDRIAMDIKGGLDEGYAKISRYQDTKILENIKKSIELILKSGIEYEFRTTVVPGIHDKAVLVEMANQLTAYQYPTPSTQHLTWVIQNFQPKNCLDQTFENIKPYSENELKELLASVKKILPGVVLR